MARVSSKTVLSAALKARVRIPIVVGFDSHGRQYVAASGNITRALDFDGPIEQLAAASKFLRRARAKVLRAEKRAGL